MCHVQGLGLANEGLQIASENKKRRVFRLFLSREPCTHANSSVAEPTVTCCLRPNLNIHGAELFRSTRFRAISTNRHDSLIYAKQALPEGSKNLPLPDDDGA